MKSCIPTDPATRYHIAPEGPKHVAGGHASRDPRFGWKSGCTLEGCQRAGTPRGVRCDLARCPGVAHGATPGYELVPLRGGDCPFSSWSQLASETWRCPLPTNLGKVGRCVL